MAEEKGAFRVKTIGRAMHIVGGRILVVQCDAAQLPRISGEVVDRRMKPIGKVVDLFGSVSKPLAAIQCRVPCLVMSGERLFIK